MAWTDSCKIEAVAQIKKHAGDGGCWNLQCAYVSVSKKLNIPWKILRQWYCEQFRRPYKMDLAKVYFIQAKGSGLIKIGMSLNVSSRLKALQQASPEKLRILKIIEGGRKKEFELHEKFKNIKSHSEWFQPEEELLEYIGEIN